MKKIMFIGETGAGKTTLIHVLSGENFADLKKNPKKTMAVEFIGQFIDTPGEFIENRRFYRALITTSADCQIVAMLQDSTSKTSLFPPKFSSIFNRKVVGIITKTDINEGKAERAEKFLKNAGAKEIIFASSKTGAGIDILKEIFCITPKI
jgi:ethanolamine utilization protein EutP